MTEVASPASKDARKSTKERYLELTNMSAREVRAYLNSDEFAEHGSKRLKTNAQRLLTLTAPGGKDQVSLEDTSLMRDAISAIERARYTSGANELQEALVKAKAYGFDPERGEDEKGGKEDVDRYGKDDLASEPDGSIDPDNEPGDNGSESGSTEDD